MLIVLLAFVIGWLGSNVAPLRKGIILWVKGFGLEKPPTSLLLYHFLRFCQPFFTIFFKIIRLLPCGLFLCPVFFKVYILKSRCHSGTNKKGLCMSAESSYTSIILLLVGSNGTYHVVPD